MIDINGERFYDEVIAPSYQNLVVVDFWAPWCGPCHQLLRSFGEIEESKQYPVLFKKLNVDTYTDTALDQKIMGVPHTKIFGSGFAIDDFSDPLPPQELHWFLQNALLMPLILRYSHFSDLDIPVEQYLAGLEEATEHSRRKDVYSLTLAKYYLSKDPEKSRKYLEMIPDESVHFEDKLLLRELFSLTDQDFVSTPFGKKIWAARNSLKKQNYESTYQFLIQAARIGDSAETDNARLLLLAFRQFLEDHHELNRKYKTQYDGIR